MKKVAAALLLLALTAPAGAKDWTDNLSPHMKKAFQPMLKPEWSPRKEVELTETERAEFQKNFPRVQEQARALLRAALAQPTPAPAAKP